MQHPALVPLVAFLALGCAASPSLAEVPPDESALQLESPSPRYATEVRETVLDLLQPLEHDATRVIAVVAQGDFAGSEASKIETFVADLLVKERRAVATLRGVAEFTLNPASEKTPEALARIAVGHGAADVVVIRPIRHATVGAAQPRRVLLQVVHGAEVIASRVANASALLSPVVDSGVDLELPETPVSTASAKREGPPLKIVRAFKRRAIRITPRRFFAGWGKPASVSGFRTYGPVGEPLKRETVLRTIGREDLAKQSETLDGVLPWTVAGLVVSSVGVVLAGALAGAIGVGFLVPGPPSPEDPFLGGMLGVSAGLLIGTPLFATLALAPFVFQIDDDEVIESIREYNLAIAAEVGLQVDDVPFYYLGL